MKFSLGIFLLVAAAAVSTAHLGRNGKVPPRVTDLKSLSHLDRLKLFWASKLTPNLFQNAPKEVFAELQGYDKYPSINNFFVDARQLFTQAKKISPTENLPELRWGYSFIFCYEGFCIDIDAAYSTNDSRITGGENISSKTNITPTHIFNEFHVPLFNWSSPGFLLNITDYIDEKFHLTRNSFYAFEDVTIAVDCDYGFVPGLGIQLDNLTIHFNAGKVRGAIQEMTIWDFDGNLLECRESDPENFKIDEYMMESWNWAKIGFTSGLEYNLNCFLSNGRSDPDNCLEGDNADPNENLERDYFRFLNLQLIQTIGLGALLE